MHQRSPRPAGPSAAEIIRLAGRVPSFLVVAAAVGAIAAPAAAQTRSSASARPGTGTTSANKPAAAKPAASAQPAAGGTTRGNANAQSTPPRVVSGAAGAKKADDGKGDAPDVRVSEHQTVDLHVKDEDLSTVLEMLSIQTQMNIITSKNVSARVTATLYNVTFYEALDSILHVNGFGYVQQGNFIYVYTIPELEEIQKNLNKRIAKVIHLNFLNAGDAAEFVKPMLSQGGELKTSTKVENFQLPDNAPVGKDDYALGATLVVIDFEDNVQAVEKLIAELDTRPAQVLVEATIVQTALNEANAFGVDFSVIGDLKFTDFINVGGPRRVADAIIAGGNGSANSGLSPDGNHAQAASSTPGNTTGPATFKLGILSDDIAIFLRALDEVSDTTILSNPKVLALNRQPARVLVGRRVGYLNTTATDTSTTQTVEFLDTGTQLYFRPFVSNDGTIRMELKPSVSEAIIREAKNATGAAVSIPDEVTQQLTTNVLVRDGQTIVLGGLFRESTQFTRRQVPFLGDIPLVGAAFRGHDDTTQRSEIIFMVTPSIVTDTLIADSADRAKADTERLRAGTRQGLLPFSREKMTATLNVEAEHLAKEGEYEKAMWTIQRSLSLNPFQPDAYRLREKMTGEREVWPDRSLLNESIGAETSQRTRDLPRAPRCLPDATPEGSVDLPMEPAVAPRSSMRPGATGPVTAPATVHAAETASLTPNAFSESFPSPAAPAWMTSSYAGDDCVGESIDGSFITAAATTGAGKQQFNAGAVGHDDTAMGAGGFSEAFPAKAAPNQFVQGRPLNTGAELAGGNDSSLTTFPLTTSPLTTSPLAASPLTAAPRFWMGKAFASMLAAMGGAPRNDMPIAGVETEGDAR